MPPESTNSEQRPATARKKGLLRRLLGPWTFLILALALGGYFYYQQGLQQEDQEQEQKQPPKNVRIAPVATQDLEVSVQGLGTLQALETVHIKPEVAGKIQKLHFQEGGFVPQGELLFEIERKKLSRRLLAQEAALEEARAKLKNARLTHQRLSLLRQQDMVSEERYDQAQAELGAAAATVNRLESEVELARLELQDTAIHAPMSGLISESEVDPGTFVSVGEPLALLYATDPLEIAFFVPEKYSGRVESGQQVRVKVAAFPEHDFQGEVTFVSPTVQKSSRKLKVRAQIDNPENRLKPGTFASASLILETRKDRLVIPETALVSTREGYMVYVLDQEQELAEAREVKTGIRKPGMVEIRQGLEAGDAVVESGHMQLQDGSRLSIQEEMPQDWPAELQGTPTADEDQVPGQATGGQAQ
ncbi:MAG: efflux RND transporter periplasmic adaptor subunit [Desulfohalobiaceae bacterium]